MEQMRIIRIELAKRGFQLRGAREDKVGETPRDYAKANAALEGTKPSAAHELRQILTRMIFRVMPTTGSSYTMGL